MAQSPRDFARILHSWPWTSRVGSAVRPAIVSCLLQSYSLRPARIVNSLVVILLHTHPNFILVFTTRCENLLLLPCTLRLPIPVPCCPKDHACTHAMLPRAHLFSVVTSRSVASAGLLTHVTIFIRSTSIKPQCFGCLWRLHHADQTGTSGFSGSRSFLPAFLGWCRGTLVTSGLVLPRGRIFLYTSPFHFFFRGRARLVLFFFLFFATLWDNFTGKATRLLD